MYLIGMSKLESYLSEFGVYMVTKMKEMPVLQAEDDGFRPDDRF